MPLRRRAPFKDINPRAPPHVLVVSKRQVATLNDLAVEDDALVGSMFRAAAAIAKEHGYHERGCRTVFDCGRERAVGLSRQADGAGMIALPALREIVSRRRSGERSTSA